VRSPSAEVQGHSPTERRIVTGKRDVEILELHLVVNYAVRLVFDETGIFSWEYLFELGSKREDYWRDYLGELAANLTVRGRSAPHSICVGKLPITPLPPLPPPAPPRCGSAESLASRTG